MSASIYWEPSRKSNKRVSTNTPSAFIEAMTAAFGHFPISLSDGDLSALTGMSVVYSGGGPNPYNQLIHLIKRFDSITIRVQT